MVLVNGNILMDPILANGKIVNEMEKEHLLGLMVIPMLVIILRELNMEKENFNGKMEIHMTAIG